MSSELSGLVCREKGFRYALRFLVLSGAGMIRDEKFCTFRSRG